jgi:hypothetical protein
MASHAMSVSRFTLLLSACDNRAGKRSGRAHDQHCCQNAYHVLLLCTFVQGSAPLCSFSPLLFHGWARPVLTSQVDVALE